MARIIFFWIAFSWLGVRGQDHAAGLERLKETEKTVRGFVVLDNKGGELPLRQLPGLVAASVHFAYPSAALFDSMANKYWRVNSFSGDTITGEAGFNLLHDRLKLFNLVIVECAAGTDWRSGLGGFFE